MTLRIGAGIDPATVAMRIGPTNVTVGVDAAAAHAIARRLRLAEKGEEV